VGQQSDRGHVRAQRRGAPRPSLGLCASSKCDPTLLRADEFEAAAERPGVILQFKGKAVIDFKANVICTDCNARLGRWDEDFARPIIEPMMRAQRGIVLTPDQQRIVARWTSNVSFFMRLTVKKQVFQPLDHEIRWVRDQDEPPGQTIVWFSAYQGSAPAWASIGSAEMYPSDLPASEPPSLHMIHGVHMTLLIGYLVLQISQFPDRGTEPVFIRHTGAFTSAMSQIWPMPGYNVPWPPILGVNDEGLAKLSDIPFRNGPS
jgi:hypothetical protein